MQAGPFQFDREKYIQIARDEGVAVALTTLHRDTERLEFETFESEKGWQPDLFEFLKQVRDFSRELWDMRLDDRHQKTF